MTASVADGGAERSQELLYTVQGIYFDGRTSRDHPASVELGRTAIHLHVPGLSLEQTWAVREVQLEGPLAGARRSVMFPGGGHFDTLDAQTMHAWERQVGHNRGLRLVHAAESLWSTALLAIGMALVGTYLFMQFGVPWLAQQAALHTTPWVSEDEASFSTALPDMKPSTLPAAQQERIQQEFKRIVAWTGKADQYPFRLYIVDGQSGDEPMGINAYANQYNTIVLSDDLVQAMKDERSVYAVLAHEVGHVLHQDVLAGLYRSYGLTVVVAVLTGEAINLPNLLTLKGLDSSYTRVQESKADEVEARYMLETYGTVQPSVDFYLDAQRANSKDAVRTDGRTDADHRLVAYLLSHPMDYERIAYMRRIEEEWKANRKLPQP